MNERFAALARHQPAWPPVLDIQLPEPPVPPTVQGLWWLLPLALLLSVSAAAGWWCAGSEKAARLEAEGKLGRAVKEIHRLRDAR